MQTKQNAAPAFAPYAPPSKVEQIELARQRGPADALELEQLAQHCEWQQTSGEFKLGYYRAERLRLLAHTLGGILESPSSGAGQETIDSLRAHADNGGVRLNPTQCRALATLILEYETSLAYALRRLEGRDEEVQQLQRTVADLAEDVEAAESDQEPIVFAYFFAEEAPADSLGAELGLELVSLLDALDPQG